MKVQETNVGDANAKRQAWVGKIQGDSTMQIGDSNSHFQRAAMSERYRIVIRSCSGEANNEIWPHVAQKSEIREQVQTLVQVWMKIRRSTKRESAPDVKCCYTCTCTWK